MSRAGRAQLIFRRPFYMVVKSKDIRPYHPLYLEPWGT